MLKGYSDGVQEHQHNHEPVEPLLLNRMPNPKAESLFCYPKIAFALFFGF